MLVLREDRVIIVEGYLDFIRPFVAGVENVAASQGTALTPDQIRLIRRYTRNVTMLFDMDPAGQSAALRSLDVLLEDRDEIAVIVECKQGQPSVDNVRQLQHYLKQFQRAERQKVRGILVHGGARKLRADVRRAAGKKPTVELVQFSVGVDFSRSG